MIVGTALWLLIVRCYCKLVMFLGICVLSSELHSAHDGSAQASCLLCIVMVCLGQSGGHLADGPYFEESLGMGTLALDLQLSQKHTTELFSSACPSN